MDNNENQEIRDRSVNHDSFKNLSQEKTQFRRKRSKTVLQLPWYVIAFTVIALIVIVFAFIMEARTNKEPDDAAPPPVQPGVQGEINRQSWIIQELLPENEFSRPGTKLESINGIVIHNIGNPGTTAMQNRNYFANLAETQERHASSNFIICLDGTVIQCVPVDEIAYASTIRNADTLSIEVCHPDDTGKFTDESYAAAVRLTAWLCERYGLDSNDVIRHFDVQGKECPRYFVLNEDAWERFKADVKNATG